MTNTIEKGYSVVSVCDYIKISRQAYYKRLWNIKAKTEMYNKLEDTVIKERINRSRVGLRRIYHKNKLYTLLGINQYEDAMSFRGHALKPYKSKIKTTDSRGNHNKFPNRVSGMKLDGENQVIAGDISYYQANGELYYIFHFVDCYTLEIKGLTCSKTQRGIIAEKCLRQVLKYNRQSKYKWKMYLHTDGGLQYRSANFQTMLKNAEARPSHAQNCFENGLSERVNGIIKNEYLLDYDVKSEKQLNKILKKIQYEMNEVWPSEVLGNKTPKEFAEDSRKRQKKDRLIREMKEVKLQK